ncbi:MAG: hypothetical protein MJE68_03205, partial [Proteobacteria bacterium]|nr:hypothetical protein [Pseudomonadota bacterium]
MTIERQEMVDHLEKQCERRMAVCTYCKVHRAAYEDISQNHHPVCPQVPVPCPKGCGKKPLRKNIKTHVENWCLKNPQPCPFHVVGCTEKLPGHQMEKHLSDRAIYKDHLSNMEKTVTALRKDICEKDSQIKILQKSLDKRDAQVGDLLSEIEKKEIDMRKLTERKEEMIGNLKDELKMCEAQRSRLEDQGRRNEQVMNTLQKELSHLNEVCAQIRRATESKITSLFQEIAEKSKQIKMLLEKDAHEETVAKQLKNENAELRKCTDTLRKEYAKLKCSSKKENADLQECISCLKRKNEELKNLLEAKISGMKGDLKRKVQSKADYADTLKRQVRELQQVVLSQKEDLKWLTEMGKQERDSLKKMAEQARCER